MSHSWLILTFSWFVPASLQFINTGEARAEAALDPFEATIHYPLPYFHYRNLPHLDSNLHSDAEYYNQFYHHDDLDQPPDLQIKRRAATDNTAKSWLPNLIDIDQTSYVRGEEKTNGNPFIVNFSGVVEDNITDILDILDPKEKKNFSPWGGKRSKDNAEQTWTWKRTSGFREPSMPKRVRFSPWGGKRSGQIVLKPANKASKVIFSTTFPELTRIVSNFSPNGERLDLAGYQFIPMLDKRHPIKFLALSTKVDDKTFRDALPFRTFLDSLPMMYKPGQPYFQVNLKKDGKRKVKFSAWGGKRSPPIIGPIWTPPPQDVKDSTLNTMLMLRNNQATDDSTKAL